MGFFWETIWVGFGRRLRGGAKKGLKRARSYIYIATRAFWALFGAWGGSCKGQPRRARKGPPTNPLLTGGHAELWRTTRNPKKAQIPKTPKMAKLPKMAKMAKKGKIVKKGEIGQISTKWRK